MITRCLCILTVLAQVSTLADGPDAVVMPIAAVRAPAKPGQDPRVVVRGRVTWVSREQGANDYAAVQDDTAGIWIDIPLARKSGVWQGEDAWQTIFPGMLVEVSGIRDRDDQTFAPQIIPESIRSLASADDVEFPDAPTTTADRLFSGLDDSQRVRIEGVLQGVASRGPRWLLSLEAGGRRFRVICSKAAGLPPASDLIDATVAATGVATTSYTTRGQFVTPTIFLARAGDLEIVTPPPTAAFDAPEIPLDRLGRLIPGVDVRHRIRTRGTVSYEAGGKLFFLQSQAIGVRVEALETVTVRPGDVLEVAGFLDRERVLGGRAQAAGICNAIVKVIGRDDRPPAIRITPDDIVAVNRTGRVAEPGDYDGCLIECKAVVGDLRDESWTALPLLAGKTTLVATMADEVRTALPPLTQGCEVLVRGIVQFELEPPLPGSLPQLSRISLIIPEADDISVISRPSWWTPRRLLTALAMLGVALAIVLGWVVLLRREVAVQSKRLAAEIAERERAAIEFDVALRERSRLAGNLHDTVLQTVTGIGYQLKACERAQGTAHAEPERLGTAQRMVEHAVDQLRGAVWAMRTVPLEGKTFPAALEALGARMQAGHAAQIVVHVAGVERDVPEHVSGNLVLIAQEAVHNALQHARAGAIDVMALFQDDAVGVVVHDDGLGFDAANPPTSIRGHFGLKGMRDRMRDIGGSVVIDSQPGTGTTITATVPLAAAEHLTARPVSLNAASS